jgi:hypothetical protein
MNERESRKLIGAIQVSEERLKEACKRFLVSNGWRETCQTPGSYWLWTKKVTIHRSYRKPEFIGTPTGFVPNPEAGGWNKETITYDALCSLEDAIRIETAMISERPNHE